MSYVIWMAILAVIAALLFTAQRTFPETRDYPGSKILLLAKLLKPGGVLILALMVFITFFASVHQVPPAPLGVVSESLAPPGPTRARLHLLPPPRHLPPAHLH